MSGQPARPVARRPLRSFANIHAHGAELSADTVLSISPGDAMAPEGYYSIGIHPWDTPATADALRQLEEAVKTDPRVVAIGEAGLDKLRGAPLDEQERVFEAQIELAERLGLPLIIHCVRALDRLLRLRKRHPSGQWILHGFRGGEATARQLLDAGIDLSFGARYNEAAYAATPPSRRYHETD